MCQIKCSEYKYYDNENNYCVALSCNPLTLNCDELLPCEMDEDCRKEQK